MREKSETTSPVLTESANSTRAPEQVRFTPGPWSIVDQHSAVKTTYRVVCPDRLMPLSDIARLQPELLANARLIAAAPDMYAALVAAADHLEYSGLSHGHRDVLDDIKSALAKARGAS